MSIRSRIHTPKDDNSTDQPFQSRDPSSMDASSVTDALSNRWVSTSLQCGDSMGDNHRGKRNDLFVSVKHGEKSLA